LFPKFAQNSIERRLLAPHIRIFVALGGIGLSKFGKL